MKHKREKLMRIMNELVIFCENINMWDININFKLAKNHGEVTVSGYSENPPLERLKNLEYILNAPRQKELEEYYWALVGEDHGHQELEMVGILVDGGTINYVDQILTICIYRKD